MFESECLSVIVSLCESGSMSLCVCGCVCESVCVCVCVCLLSDDQVWVNTWVIECPLGKYNSPSKFSSRKVKI